MDELSFQTAVARYLTDTAYRHDIAREGPDLREGTQHGNVNGPNHRLAALHQGRADMFARLLIANRLSKAVRGLPWTTFLLGHDLKRIAIDFNQESPPRNSRLYNEASAFGRYVMTLFERTPPSQGYLPDILRYELTVLEMRFEFDMRYESDTEYVEGNPSLHVGAELHYVDTTVVPVPLRHWRLVSFAYDVEAIGKVIELGERPHNISDSSVTILFYVMPSGDLGQDVVSSECAAFLRWCNGQSTLADVIKGLAQELGELEGNTSDDFSGACAVLFASLVERRVLGYR